MPSQVRFSVSLSTLNLVLAKQTTSNEEKAAPQIEMQPNTVLLFYSELFLAVVEIFLEQRVQAFVNRKLIGDGSRNRLLAALRNLLEVDSAVLRGTRHILPTEDGVSAVRHTIFVLLTADFTRLVPSRHKVLPQLLSVRSVAAEQGVVEEHSASAAGTAESIGTELMDSLVVAHLQRELAVEVGLGDMNLQTVHVGASVLSQSVDVQHALAGILVAHVGQSIGSNLPLVVSNNLSTGSDVGVESQLLGSGVIRELASRSSRILLKLVTQSTIGVLNIQGDNLSAGGADSLVRSLGVISGRSHGDVVSPHDLGGLVLEVGASLELQQAVGHDAVGAADGDSLVALQGSQLTTLLTSDVSLLLRLGDGSILQLVQREKISL